ncbi:Autoinducer 2 sensor kinase/phosphatase LuxQ [compost metagenome]
MLFAKHNLLTDPPFSKLDLICCRNLLIYLDRDAQAALLQTFHFALKPDGYLFLGNSESADVCTSLFTAVDKKNRIYRRRNVARALRSPLQLHDTVMPAQVSPLPSPVSQKKLSYGEIHQRVLEQYAPPSVILDPDGNIVHSSDRAGKFLRHVAGEPTHDILTLIQPDLRLELRTAIFQANHSGKSVEARRVRLSRDGRTFYINMIVRPFHETAANVDYLLVLFDEVEAVMATEEGTDGQVKDSVLTQLEAELQRTKEQLQFTVEHYDTSTEELKASNEELQAINEELRSATEELETSKEELQSINEELITVNAELKAKIDETGKINDDLQNLIVSTDIATVFVDRNMRIKWFTPQATHVFNIIANDTGRSLLDITHRLEYPELATDARRVFESLRQIEREVFSLDKHWYLVRLLPYRTADDRIEGAVLTFIDISGRKQAEEQLRAGEAHMALIAQSTRDYAIVTTDTQGVITTWSRGAELIFGHSENDAIGQPLAFIYTDADRQADQLSGQLDLAKRRGYAIDQRWHMRKGGKLIFCSGVFNPLSDPQLRGFAYIARDTTRDQERFEKQRARLKHTQASNQLKDEFFAVMSHELKHPLNLIQLNAELLSRIPETRSSNPAERATQAILRAVRSQAQIIDDLLDISRITTGKLKLDTTRVEFKHLLLEIIEVLKPMAVAAGVSIEVKSIPDTDVWLMADSIRLEQVVWNLLNNALKFTPQGKGVQVHMEAEDAFIRLDIIDEGQGIDPASIARIFDMFGQAAMHHATRSRHGLGIGLALVKQLVEAHQGKIEAASDGPGKGARFSVWLPHSANAGANELPERPAEEGLLDSVKVLLVDDSSDVLEMMQLLLKAEDAIVSSAAVSSDGLALARSEVFDLMLLDIGMPDMDGHELMRQIRKDSLNQKTPAIALTGYGREEDVARAAQSGFDRHLSKPISLEALIDAALKLIQAKKA